MSSELVVTKTLSGDHWVVTGEITSSSLLPKAIFIYLNTGTEVLGEFFGTCSVDELNRFQEYVGQAIPMFGNKYIKYAQAKIKVSIEEDVNAVIAALVKNVKGLSLEYQSKPTVTTIVQIP